MRLAVAEAAVGHAPLRLGSRLCRDGLEAAEQALRVFQAKGEAELQAEACLASALLHSLHSCEDDKRRARSATEMAKQALQLATAAKLPSLQGWAQHALAAAIALCSRGEPDAWLGAAEQALEHFQDQEDLRSEAKHRLAMARWYSERDHHSQAMGQARESLDIFQELGAASHLQVPAAAVLARAEQRLGRQQPALRTAQDALRLAATEGSRGRAELLALLLYAETQFGAWQLGPHESERTAKEGLALSQKLRDPLGEAHALRVLLQLHWHRLANSDGSRKNQEESVRGIGEVQATAMQAASVLSKLPGKIGGLEAALELMEPFVQLQVLLGRSQEALPVVAQVRDDAKEEGSVASRAKLRLFAGKLELESSQFAQGCTSAQEAARLFEDAGDELGAANALSILAGAQMALGHISNGRQSARMARRRFGEIGKHEEELGMRLLVAQACFHPDAKGNSQLRDAFREAQDALKLASEIGKPELTFNVLQLMAEVCIASGDHGAALQAAENAMQCKCAIFKPRTSCRLILLAISAKAKLQLTRYDEARLDAEKALSLEKDAKEDAREPYLLHTVTGWLEEVAQLLEQLESGIEVEQPRPQQQQEQEKPYQQQRNQEEPPRRTRKEVRQPIGPWLRCRHCQREAPKGPECTSCGSWLPWPDCKFCPDCGKRQRRQNKDSVGQAVKPGFLSRQIEREESHPLKRRIQELVGQLLGLDSSRPLDADTPLGTIGLTSGAAVMLRDELQDDVKGIQLPPTLLLDYPTINEAIGYITGKLR